MSVEPVAMEKLSGDPKQPATEWAWDGYLARGTITLLTSQWKTGKTTLLAGLLRHLSLGKPFLGRKCVKGSALVVSEESRAMWAERLKMIPVGPRIDLLSRPFLLNPTPDEWAALTQSVLAQPPALFVVDPLASFLPGHSESDPAALRALLHPLRRLAEQGAAVLVLHHPRKRPSEEGCAARGSGALLGFVDVILELHAVGGLHADNRLRRLVARSRYQQTPPKLVFEWTPGTAEFRPVDDQYKRQFEDNWEVLLALLQKRSAAVTHHELLDHWPPEHPRPSRPQLYRWLDWAAEAKRVSRFGAGTKADPYRYCLPRPSEVPDLSPPPPLPPLQFVRTKR